MEEPVSRAELAQALSADERKRLPVADVVQMRLSPGEEFVTMAAAMSGKYGLVALTSQRLGFVWRQAIGTNKRWYPLEGITAVETEGTSLAINSRGAVAFHDVSPAERRKRSPPTSASMAAGLARKEVTRVLSVF